MKLRLLALLTSLSLLGLASCKDRLPSQPPTVAIPDTIARYSFDGNTTDVSNHGHNGIISGASSYATDRFGNPGALTLGSNAMVSVTSAEDLNLLTDNSYSISSWFYLGKSTSGTIVSKMPPNSYAEESGYALGAIGTSGIITVGASVLGINNGNIATAQLTPTYQIAGNEWHMITLVVSAHRNISVYIDSVLGETQAVEIGYKHANNTVPLTFGPFGDSTKLDDILFLHRDMSAAEVSARFHEGGWYAHHDTVVVPPPPPPSAWSKGDFGTSDAIQGVTFPGSWIQSRYYMRGDRGYACGMGGTLLRSTDSGTTWNSLPSGTTENLYRITFYDIDNGIAGGNHGTLLKTTDGGATWTKVSAPFQTVNGEIENIRDVRFVDQTHVVMVGGVGNLSTPSMQGFVMVSSDAGDSWNRVKECPISLYSIGTAYGRYAPGYTWSSFHVVGAQGQIYITGDGGANWKDESVAGQDFLGCDFGSQVLGAAVSASGGIYFTSDAGSHWNAQSSGVSSSIRTVYLVNNSDEVWAAGDNGVILHSMQNGSSWTRADLSGVSVQWNDIVARDAHHMALVGANGSLYWLSH